MTEYQGYTNYETWRIALELDNNYPLYQRMQAWTAESARASVQHPNTLRDIWTEEQAHVFGLADRIRALFEGRMPDTDAFAGVDAAIPHVWSDFMTHTLSRVNWNEIAEQLVQTYYEQQAPRSSRNR